MAKVSPMLHFNAIRVNFYILWTGFQWVFLNLLGGIDDYFGQKILKTKVVFMKSKRKKLKPLGHPTTLGLGRRSASHFTPTVGPSRVAKWFKIIFILHFMKPPWFQDFITKTVVKPPKRLQKIIETRLRENKTRFLFTNTKKFKKYHWNQVTKKLTRLPFKTRF